MSLTSIGFRPHTVTRKTARSKRIRIPKNPLRYQIVDFVACYWNWIFYCHKWIENVLLVSETKNLSHDSILRLRAVIYVLLWINARILWIMRTVFAGIYIWNPCIRMWGTSRTLQRVVEFSSKGDPKNWVIYYARYNEKHFQCMLLRKGSTGITHGPYIR